MAEKNAKKRKKSKGGDAEATAVEASSGFAILPESVTPNLDTSKY